MQQQTTNTRVETVSQYNDRNSYHKSITKTPTRNSQNKKIQYGRRNIGTQRSKQLANAQDHTVSSEQYKMTKTTHYKLASHKKITNTKAETVSQQQHKKTKHRNTKIETVSQRKGRHSQHRIVQNSQNEALQVSQSQGDRQHEGRNS